MQPQHNRADSVGNEAAVRPTGRAARPCWYRRIHRHGRDCRRTPEAHDGTSSCAAITSGADDPDPSRIPPRQLMRVPLRLPADTGTPVPVRRRRQWPEWTFQRTPRPIRVKPVKQWEKMQGRAATACLNGLLSLLTCVVVNVCTGPVPALPRPGGRGCGRGGAQVGVRGGVRGGEAAYGEAGGKRVPGRRTRGGGTAKRAGHGGARRRKGAGKGGERRQYPGNSNPRISGRKLAGKFWRGGRILVDWPGVPR